MMQAAGNPRRRLRGVGALALLALSLAGCASRARPDTSDADGSGERAITVEVNNNLIPSSALTIWAVPDGGTQILIGNVGPAERKELQFVPIRRGMTYRLRARLTGGRDRLSNPVSMLDVEHVTWNVQSNLATVRN